MDKVLNDINTILGNVMLFTINVIVGIIYIIAFITVPIWGIPYLIHCVSWNKKEKIDSENEIYR